MIWLQILTTVVVCGAIITDVIKNKHNKQYQTDCNSCVFLKQRTCPSLTTFEYRCAKYHGFDKPPIFCADYKKRSEEE